VPIKRDVMDCWHRWVFPTVTPGVLWAL
jgi:hypothetical protein